MTSGGDGAGMVSRLLCVCLSVGGFEISLLFVFFAPTVEKRHWLYSKVHIPPAGSIFDVSFRNKLLARGGWPNGWPMEGPCSMTAHFRR